MVQILNNTKFRNINSNPNNNKNNLGVWILINFIIVFGVVAIIKGNLISIISFLLDLLITQYSKQILLYIIIFIIDVVLMMILNDRDVLIGGTIATLIYFVLDYFYLVKSNFTDFSLLIN
jgi:hypothetical protein